MKTKTKIFIAFILNLLFSVFELIGGILTGSVAIASDAVHDFGDAISIGGAYFLEKISGKKPDEKFTYGYARFSVLGGLLTTVILLISSGVIIYNAILRIINPLEIHYNGMIIVAIIGLVVNLVATYFTHGGHSINQKAVNLHMLEDVLGWLVVLIGSIVIKYTHLYVIDPILSILVAIFVIINSVKNLLSIGDLFLIKTPKNVDVAGIIKHVKKVDGVVDVHHVHIWTIDGETNCATLHLVVEELNSDVKKLVKDEFKEHGVSHVTIEMETALEGCEETCCDIKPSEGGCHHHHHGHAHAHNHEHCHEHAHNHEHCHEHGHCHEHAHKNN